MLFLSLEFGTESGYWPWAIIMAIISAVILWAANRFLGPGDEAVEE